MRGRRNFSSPPARTLNAFGWIAAAGAVGLVLGGVLVTLIVINRFWPDSAITVRGVLNFFLVLAVAALAFPLAQRRSFRYQYHLHRGSRHGGHDSEAESHDALPAMRPPRSVAAIRSGLLVAGAAALVILFGPLSLADGIFEWLQRNGFGSASGRLVEILALVFLAGAFLVMAAAGKLYRLFFPTRSGTQRADPQWEANRIWFICLAGTWGLSAGMCIVVAFLMRRFL